MALQLEALALGWDKWIHRRTDCIRVVGDGAYEWRSTFEVTVPTFRIRDPILSALTPTLVPLPLQLQKKALMVEREIRDESGMIKSAWTTRQHRIVAAAMLQGIAVRALGRPVTKSVAKLLAEVTDEPAAARTALEKLRSDRRLWSRLKRDGRLVALLTDLEVAFLLTVFVPNDPGARHVLSVTYGDRLEPALRPRRRAWTSIGQPLALPLSLSIGSAQSYHAELHAPPGLTFALGDRDAQTATISGLEAGGAMHPRGTLKQQSDELLVHVSGASRGDSLVVPLVMRNKAFGMALSAVILSGVTLAIFALGLVARLVWGYTPNGAPVAVLIVFPTLYAIVIFRPGGHAVTDQFLRQPKYVVVVAAVVAWLGAAVLAVHPATEFPSIGWLPPAVRSSRMLPWTILTAASLVLFVVAYLMWRLTWTAEKEYKEWS